MGAVNEGVIDFGTYFNNNRQRVFDVEKALGRQMTLIRQANGARDWNDVTSTKWMADNAKALHPRMMQACLVLWPKSMTGKDVYERAARGEFDNQWRTLFRNLITGVPGDYIVYYSPLYEGNGNWFSFSFTKSLAGLAKEVFARVARIAKEISPRFEMILNFAEWNSDASVGFLDVWPGMQYCKNFGINLYVKDENQSTSPAKILDILRNSKMGLYRMLREGKSVGITQFWIPELGLRPHAKGAAIRETFDLTTVVDGLFDDIIANTINFLHWRGMTETEAYVDHVLTGAYPKLDAALVRNYRRLHTHNDKWKAGTPNPTPVPTTPAPAPAPTPTPTPSPAMEPNVKALHDLNTFFFNTKGLEGAALATMKSWEDLGYHPLSAAGVKPGPAPAGKITDADQALQALYMAASGDTTPGLDGVRSKVLEVTLPWKPAPAPVPTPTPGDEASALREQVKALQAANATLGEQNAILQGKLSALKDGILAEVNRH